MLEINDFLTTVYSVNVLLLLFNATLLAITLYKEIGLNRREKKLQKDENEILKDAHDESAQIIQKAINKAKNIIEETEVFKDDAEKEMRNSINQISNKYNNQINKLFNLYSQKSKEMISETEAMIEKRSEESMNKFSEQTLSEIENFVSSTKRNMLAKRSEVEEKTNRELVKTIDELTVYKAQMKDKINSKAQDLVLKLSKEVLKDSLDIESHEKLILKYLEKAKQEKLIVI